MSLAFEDFERDYPVAEEKPKAAAPKAEGKAGPSGSVRPPFKEVVGNLWDQARPKVEGAIESAVNPMHYKGDREDYTNIDWIPTLVHGGAEAVGAKRLWDFATGKSYERETERMKAEAYQRQVNQSMQSAATRGAPASTITPIPSAPAQPATPAVPAPQVSPTAQAATPHPQPVAPANVPAYVRKQQAATGPVQMIPAAPAVPGLPTPQQATQAVVESGKIAPGVGGTIKESESPMLGASDKAKAEQEIAKKGIKPPEQKTFATAEELQAKRPGTVFKPGWGGADSWLVDQVGKDRAKLIRETMNQGQPFGGTKADLERAAQAMNEFGNLNWQHQHEPHIPSRENRIRLGIEPPEQHGALNKTFKNAVKVGGTAGLLLTAAEAANAAQREKGGEKGATNEFLFNLLSAIPGLGTAFNAGTFSGGLNTNEEQELARRRQMSPTISR